MQTLKTVVVVDGKVRSVRMPSHSRRGEVHTVVLSCTCEGFTYHGYCYHLEDAAKVVRADAVAQRVRTNERLGR